VDSQVLLCFGKADVIGGTHASYSAHANYSEDFVLWVVTEFVAAPPFACRYELLEAFVEILMRVRTSADGQKWCCYPSEGSNYEKHGYISSGIIDCDGRICNGDA
jgi:hypothetical protein